MRIVDDASKKNVRWWNTNIFFAATILIVTVNIFIYAFCNDWQVAAFPMDSRDYFYPDGVDFTPIFRGIFNSFSHENWQHVLLNMLCFLVAGLYLERKTGSIYLILLVFASAFFKSGTMAALSYYSHFTHGYSGINYFLYAYIIIDYLFSFQKAKRNRFNTIFGAVVVALIYLAMCFNGGTNSFGFEWYPYDLTHNPWHYSAFFGGIPFGLTVQLVQVKTRKEASPARRTAPIPIEQNDTDYADKP
jgi:membrane associated rhomboid family serine protease